MRCKAKAKRTGKQCKLPAMRGREVCALHGGKTPRGKDSPHYKHGRYSKYLPDRLADRYQEAQQDAELLTLRAEIALTDARTSELLAQVNTGESVSLWHDVRDAYHALRSAIQSNNVPATMQSLSQLDTLIGAGQRDYEVWQEVSANIEQRRRLVESERKHMVAMEQMITAERAMLLIAAVVNIVRENVRDKEALRVISQNIGELVAVDASA